MADNRQISEKLRSVRTMEDVVNLLSILFTNLNNQNEQYYDMFLNPEPMDLELERYDENGVLEVVTHPNVAKMRISVYTGKGNPNGVQPANLGALYIDTISGDLYYKAVGSANDSNGWILIWNQVNLNYLAPDGNASQLTDLNMNAASAGILKVQYGGTGTNYLTGILKGNGTSAVTSAVSGIDYLDPNVLLGLIMYCPFEPIPDGWLVCDGAVYNLSERPELQRLCNKLGNRYGGDGTTTFGVPNLVGKYAKGCTADTVGTSGASNVGEHEHQVIGSTDFDGAHTHTRGTMNITGQIGGLSWDKADSRNGMTGAFYWGTKTVNGAGQGTDDKYGYFDASRSWTGATSSTPHSHSINITASSAGAGETDVSHVELIPIIKY